MDINSTKTPSNVTVSRGFVGPKKNDLFNLASHRTVDINECETKLGLRTCGSNKECVNTPGGYDCVDAKPARKVTTKWVMRLRHFIFRCTFAWSAWTLSRPRFTSDSFTRKPLTCTKGYQQQGDKCVGEWLSLSSGELKLQTNFCEWNYFHFPISMCDAVIPQRRNYPDIDECSVDRNACASTQNCINLAGSFECECKTGFNLDKALNTCVGKGVISGSSRLILVQIHWLFSLL